MRSELMLVIAVQYMIPLTGHVLINDVSSEHDKHCKCDRDNTVGVAAESIKMVTGAVKMTGMT